MKLLLISTMITMISTAGFAETLGHALQKDGPWIDLPEGVIINASAPTYDDILMMADLDGDPAITTAEEAQMIALLSQVLLGSPVTQ